MLDEGRQLPAVAVGRANLHGRILVQQVTSLSPGRSHAVLQDVQQGGRPLGTASHRSQSIRPPRDLYEEAGRPGVRRKAVRIQSRQQGLQDLQPNQGNGRGKPQWDLFWRRRHTACPWASRQKTTTTRNTSSDSNQHWTDL